MSALTQLTNRLRDSEATPKGYRTLLGHGTDVLTQELRKLEASFQVADRYNADDDQIRQSLQAFIRHERLTTLRDARRVCFGLDKAVTDGQPSLFNDRRLFPKVLDDAAGVGQWLTTPRAFRRCYRGLAASYFAFDAVQSNVTQIARRNWASLRDYLHAHTDDTHVTGREPDWLETLDHYRHVFTNKPFGDLPHHVLAGDKKLLQRVFDDLMIDGHSWFQRDLLLEQIRHSTTLDDASFIDRINQHLSLVDDKSLIRDESLALLLDRYMQCTEHPEHKTLRDAAVSWWGNPWLPSQELHWGRVDKSTRNTIAHWLQKEFIDTFFSKMATNGINDRRRAAFWSRYIGTFADLKFGLGNATLYSRDQDLKKLVQEMDGMYGPMASNTAGDAFIMIWNHLAVVEFSGYSNAVYGYDAQRKLPFVIEKGQPLRTTVDAVNSLKQSSKVLWLQHQDSIRGFDRWEDRFASELKDRFGIVPVPRDKPIRSATDNSSSPTLPPRASEPLQELLDTFVRHHHLRVEDLRPKGGNLWIYARNDIRAVSDRLRSEGFQYKAGKGWWKKA